MKKKYSKEEQLQIYIEKVLENINLDRAKADYLLQDIMEEIRGRKHEYKDLGLVASKYLESLTRCNEQLVRLVALLKPKTNNFKEELSEEDKDKLFEALQDESNNKEI